MSNPVDMRQVSVRLPAINWPRALLVGLSGGAIVGIGIRLALFLLAAQPALEKVTKYAP